MPGLIELSSKATRVDIRRRAVFTFASLKPDFGGSALLSLLQETSLDDSPEFWRVLFGYGNLMGRLRELLPTADVPPAILAEGLKQMQSLGIGDAELRRILITKSGTPAPALNWGDYHQLAVQAMNQGDAVRGEQVYRRKELSCVTCHSIAGVGGKVGPDLGTIGASAPLDYIVESLLTPGAAVKEGYNATLVVTDDGRQQVGLLISETESELVLRDATGREVRIAKSSVEERKLVGSMMPAGLTEKLKSSELLDLIRFCSELGKPEKLRLVK